MNITIFNEYHPDERTGKTEKVYPGGIHETLKTIFGKEHSVTVATQEQAYNGLPDELLDKTDVLIWWSKNWDKELLNSVADKVVSRIRQGMGGVFLHSAKNSKPFLRLTGTTSVTAPVPWKETGEYERLFVISPSHPIAAEIPSGHIIPNEEPYCEYFDIPKPDDIVFLGGFGNGMCVRAGVTFTRGAGKIFYFQPGHDTFPTYHDPVVRRIILNAVNWAAPAPALTQTFESYKPEPQGFKAKVKKLFR